MAQSFAGRKESIGVVRWLKLLFIYSQVECHPIHLGHILVDYIAHQGQYVCLSMIFAGPYLTCLIRVIGLMDGL